MDFAAATVAVHPAHLKRKEVRAVQALPEQPLLLGALAALTTTRRTRNCKMS